MPRFASVHLDRVFGRRVSLGRLGILALPAVLVLAASCDSGGPAAPNAVSITFRFSSVVPRGTPEPFDPRYTGCVHHYAPSSFMLFASWDGFQGQRMIDLGSGSSEVTVLSVPIGRHDVYVVDLERCKLMSMGEPYAGRDIWANGAYLTRLAVVDGHEAARLAVTADGMVTP